MKKTERIGIRVDPTEKEVWERRARESGISLSQWMSRWLNLAAAVEPVIPKDRPPSLNGSYPSSS